MPGPARKTVFSRVRSLFVANDDSDIELVMVANGYASVAIAGVGFFFGGLPLPWALGLVPLLFILLFGCLLFRPTVWLAALVGTPIIGACTGLLAAGLAGRFDMRACWPVGVVGGIAGLGGALCVYRKVGRIARSL